MATTEAGHAANRGYWDRDGNFHLNGSSLYLDESGNTLTGSGVTYADDDLLGLGTGNAARLSWDTTDANANELLIQLPAGGAVDVPVIIIGQSIESVDPGLYNGVVDPRIAMFGVGAVATGPVLEFRKARGTFGSPTVVTSGDDCGSIDFYGAVAAGEYVRSAQILAETTGTIATTRGPGVITFKTATDAAPSVLTSALVISAAQNVLVPGSGGLTVGSDATDRVAMKGFYMTPANVAVAVPTIANDAAENIDEVAVDVSGAFSFAPAVGDAVIAIPQEALPTDCVLLGAWVSATDQITVSFGSKEGGGGVTGANKNFKFLVIDLT